MDQTLDRMGGAGINQIAQAIDILFPRPRIIGAVENVIHTIHGVSDVVGVGEIGPDHFDRKPGDARSASCVAEDAAHLRAVLVKQPFDESPANETRSAGDKDLAAARKCRKGGGVLHRHIRRRWGPEGKRNARAVAFLDQRDRFCAVATRNADVTSGSYTGTKIGQLGIEQIRRELRLHG